MKYLLAVLVALALSSVFAQEAEPLVCEPTIEASVVEWVALPDTEPEVIKTAGKSGRVWTAQDGLATILYVTTTYEVVLDPETGEETCVPVGETEVYEYDVALVQYVNPGERIVYKGY